MEPVDYFQSLKFQFILNQTLITKSLICFALQKELAKSITVEQGKTLADAEGDVFRGLRKFQSLTRTETPLQRAGNR